MAHFWTRICHHLLGFWYRAFHLLSFFRPKLTGRKVGNRAVFCTLVPVNSERKRVQSGQKLRGHWPVRVTRPVPTLPRSGLPAPGPARLPAARSPRGAGGAPGAALRLQVTELALGLCARTLRSDLALRDCFGLVCIFRIRFDWIRFKGDISDMRKRDATFLDTRICSFLSGLCATKLELVSMGVPDRSQVRRRQHGPPPAHGLRALQRGAPQDRGAALDAEPRRRRPDEGVWIAVPRADLCVGVGIRRLSENREAVRGTPCTRIPCALP